MPMACSFMRFLFGLNPIGIEFISANDIYALLTARISNPVVYETGRRCLNHVKAEATRNGQHATSLSWRGA
jgi:hypothetical protein